MPQFQGRDGGPAVKHLHTPLDDATLKNLRAGEEVTISGTIYTARDQAHMRMVNTYENGGDPPFPYDDNIVYYVGPTPGKPTDVIGSAGPTSSYRMDAAAESLLPAGLRLSIGKGQRSEAFRRALLAHGGVYFLAIGGIGALLSERIKEKTCIAYPELKSEAIYKLRVEKFPVFVAYDTEGGDIFRTKSVDG